MNSNNIIAAQSPVSKNKSGQQSSAQGGRVGARKRQNKNKNKKNNNNNNNNGQNAERQTLQQLGAARRKAVNETMANEVGTLVKDILSQDCLYVLPRAVNTIVAPHHFETTTDFKPTVVEGGSLLSAMVFRPDPDVFFQYTEASEEIEFNPLQINQSVDYKFATNGALVSLDADILVPKIIKCSTAKSGPSGSHFSQSSKRLVDGIKYYPGIWTFSLVADLPMEIYNPTNSSFSFTGVLGHVTPDGEFVIDFEGDSIPASPHTVTQYLFDPASAGYIAWQGATSNPDSSAGFVIGFRFQSNVNIASGFEASISTTVTRDAALVWKNKSLWELLPDSAVVKAQFLAASRFSVTGFSVLVQNVTPNLLIGGGVYAARMPGDTPLPGTIPEIIAKISSQTHHKLRDNHLLTGANLPWTPEKVQDWLFQERVEFDPYNGNPLNKPYTALAMSLPGADSVPQTTLVLSIGFTMEYLTTDISNAFVKAPGYMELVELLASEISTKEVFSHNPDHLKKIGGVVKDVVTSDGFKRLASSALQAGVTNLLPLVLKAFI
jgi:hypothetical protein